MAMVEENIIVSWVVISEIILIIKQTNNLHSAYYILLYNGKTPLVDSDNNNILTAK